jgi:hypothetical protein
LKAIAGPGIRKLVPILLRIGEGGAIDQWLDCSYGKLDEGWKFSFPTAKLLKRLRLVT